MVCNVSAEMILSFVNYHGKKKVSLAEMFKSLSLEMGGDGSKITKNQLQSYIRKAESGALSISKTKLKALKKMLENWDSLSKDGNCITFADLKDSPMLLINAVIGDFEDPKKSQNKNRSDDLDDYKFNINDYLKKALGLPDSAEITKSDLQAHLQSLLSDASNDDSNGDLIDTLTNIIASAQLNSTVNEEA